MGKDREKRMEEITQLVDKIKQLPVEWQRIVGWAIEHLDQLEELGRNLEMILTLEEIQSARMEAWEEKDYAFVTLLYITEYAKKSTGNEEL